METTPSPGAKSSNENDDGGVEAQCGELGIADCDLGEATLSHSFKGKAMSIFLTSDTHFGHESIIKFCDRPFVGAIEMDDALVARWNALVREDDIVYHLGDFTLKGAEAAKRYFARLNGRIFVLPGSHDERWFEKPVDYVSATAYPITKLPPIYSLELQELRSEDGHHTRPLVRCHYAMRVWDRSHYGSIHAYGHSHGQLEGLGRSMDVGVDTNNFYPYALEEVLTD